MSLLKHINTVPGVAINPMNMLFLKLLESRIRSRSQVIINDIYPLSCPRAVLYLLLLVTIHSPKGLGPSGQSAGPSFLHSVGDIILIETDK